MIDEHRRSAAATSWIPYGEGSVSINTIRRAAGLRWYWAGAICLVAVITSVYLTEPMWNRGGRIQLIVPSDFRGLFRISRDRVVGVAPTVSSTGVLSWAVPCSGELIVEDISPFTTWHSLTAATEDGAPVPVQVEHADPDGVFLRAYPNNAA